ncbi:PadR family transcriptional regulator [Kribbella sp. NPDC058693]|uniref:PadR family transcriptional regulator n=1 Tax=Kribbella sp. NPDC058693 TaxID=3346602 RepID=UPI003650D598
MQATGLPSGTIYPIFERLERSGWLESGWESIDPVTEGRPARRYYKLTTRGLPAARQALAELYEQIAPSRRPLGSVKPVEGS